MNLSTSIAEGNKIVPPMEEKQLVESFMGNVLPLPITWNDLMPVVEKIEAMDTASVDSFFMIKHDTCRVYFDNVFNKYEHAEWVEGSKMKSVWQSVVQFISWYTSLTPINKP